MIVCSIGSYQKGVSVVNSRCKIGERRPVRAEARNSHGSLSDSGLICSGILGCRNRNRKRKVLLAPLVLGCIFKFLEFGFGILAKALMLVDSLDNGIVLDFLEDKILVLLVGKELFVVAHRDCDVHAGKVGRGEKRRLFRRGK